MCFSYEVLMGGDHDLYPSNKRWKDTSVEERLTTVKIRSGGSRDKKERLFCAEQ